SRCMRHINGVYTQRFNRRHRLDGPLFRGRFKSILIGDDNYLIQLLRYICFNPVKAGIVKTPEEYPWSGKTCSKRLSPRIKTDCITGLSPFWIRAKRDPATETGSY
ncbi:transposase, partial [bacterium]|nr:transposase [bacterium]